MARQATIAALVLIALVAGAAAARPAPGRRALAGAKARPVGSSTDDYDLLNVQRVQAGIQQQAYNTDPYANQLLTRSALTSTQASNYGVPGAFNLNAYP